MKILFTANRFPYPPFRGDKLKIFHLASQLSKQHELHLLTFIQEESDRQYLPELEKIFTSIHLVPLTKTQSIIQVIKGVFNRLPFQVNYFQSQAMYKAVAELIQQQQFDAVHVQHLRMAPYWAKYKHIPRILDLPDAYSLYWQRRVSNAKGIKKWLNNWERKRVWQYEAVLEEYDMSLVCSKEDLNYLKQEKNITNVQLLPNGVDTQTFNTAPHNYTIANTILFTGNMDYAPNVDAVLYFANDILPFIQKEIPAVQFVIAGQRPVPKVLALQQNPSIQVTGFVPDLNAIYETATIVVAPLRFGAGTQNKVLEAMAKGVPVVSHHIGFDGLNINSGEGVCLTDNAESFAHACIELLQSAEQRQKVGEKGQHIIKNNFAWPIIAQQLEKYFERVMKLKK
jgi:sugar transferase (PEP-CTERM/EpsH1 system associated)